MKQILLVLLLILNVLAVSKAEVVNTETASIVAKNHYWKFSKEISYAEITLNLSYTSSINGIPVYYVFDVNDDKGFVIIAADDNVYPVLGYSYEGNYSNGKENLPPNFSGWMDNYSDQILHTRENELLADAQISEKWTELANFSPQPKTPDNVNPLLTTNWNQDNYYNAECPEDGSGPGGHVYAGCVATAMGMVMKYHNYPDQGSGSYTYSCYPYGSLTANFGETTYDWTSMPNSLYSHNIEVATLLYHCGVGVNMQYSPGGSGAYSHDARNALVEYFTYSSDAQLLMKASYSNTTWEDMLKNELEASRPLYYAGNNGSVGHAFVCDGYQGTNYFHFNWGWSGYANGYFYVSNLNPSGSGFNQSQQAIFYVYPEGTNTLPTPENLEASTINTNDVELTWIPPFGKNLIGFNVYRNNEIIEYLMDILYLDENLDPGTYEYYVTAVSDEGESLPCESVSVLITGNNLILPPTNLSFENVGNDVLLNWDAPIGKDLLGYNVYFSDGSGFDLEEFVTDTEYLVEAPGAGVYQYYVTASYDDGESDPTDIIEFVITDVEDNIYEETKLFPNPATDIVNINSEFEIESIKVFNYAGQVVFSDMVEAKQYRINTSQYEPGIYFISIETNSGIISKRIIVQ